MLKDPKTYIILLILFYSKHQLQTKFSTHVSDCRLVYWSVMVWFGGNVLRFDPSREEFHLQQGWHSGNEFVMITAHNIRGHPQITSESIS